MKREKHSLCFYDFKGEMIYSHGGENLLEILGGMERLIVDNNFDFRPLAKNRVNKGKAYIVGVSMLHEIYKPHIYFWDEALDKSNDNIFFFGPDDYQGFRRLLIQRHDEFYRKEADREKLEREWCLPEFLSPRIALHKATVTQLRDGIHREITELEGHNDSEKFNNVLTQIHRHAGGCKHHFGNSRRTSELCYMALLLEGKGKSRYTRREFSDANKFNLFNDIRNLQNALFLDAKIMTTDRALPQMIKYLKLPNVTWVNAQSK